MVGISYSGLHGATSTTTANLMPEGTRLRLKSSIAITAGGAYAINETIVTALVYGLIVADNGSNMYFQGSTP